MTGSSTLYPLSWRRSLIGKAGLITYGVLGFGYVISIYFGIQSINTLSRLIHDEKIDEALSAHLEQIKRSHDFQQMLVLERLTSFDLPSASEALHKADLDRLLQDAFRGTDLGAIQKIVPYFGASEDSKTPDTPIAWLGRSELRIHGHIVKLKPGPGYENFAHVQQIQQNYQVLGSEVNDNIRKSLIYTNSLGLLFSFLMLGAVFWIFARILRRDLATILTGFAQWAGDHSHFRFTDGLRGELGVIATQFNSMADTIETNRRKAVYLEKIASWQVIARKMAHEIKNPLTPIQMMVSQIVRQYPNANQPDDVYKKLLDQAHEVISEEVAGLRRMVDHFSSFAKLPSPTLNPSSLAEICSKIVDLQAAGFSQHDIHFDGAPDDAVCPVDADLIRQVLINLIKNAAEANHGRRANIGVSIEERATEFEIRIADDGPGIPEELQRKIFEAYVTTKHTGPTPGMGLGLAICQKIILEHKGHIGVTSIPGKTVFSITLPKNQ